MKKLFKLSDVRANPYRDLKRFPVPEDKIESLIESIDTTGFWKNLGGREVNGKLQLASGHSRLAALKRKYKNDLQREFEFEVEELTDSDMLQRMSRENKKVYAADLGAVIESIKAAVEKLGSGEITRGQGKGQMIEVPKDTRKDSIRFAPSFVLGKEPGTKAVPRPYTASTIAIYLGYTRDNGRNGLKADYDVLAALAYLENEELQIPGWDDKALNTFRTKDGAIPVDCVIEAAKSAKTRADVSLARERAKASSEAERRKSEMQRAAEAKAEAEKAQRELDKIAAHKAKALTEKLEAQRKQDIADAEQKVADAKAKAEEARRDWDAGEAERKKAKLQAERAAVAETARKEGRRASHVKSIVEKVERVLVDDSLYELIRDLKKTTALTPAERKNLKTALQDAGVRFREHAAKF